MSRNRRRNVRRNYGIFHFLFDAFMVWITCFFWLIWIYVRENRIKNS